MRLTNTGYVGINQITNPQANLHVKGSAYFQRNANGAENQGTTILNDSSANQIGAGSLLLVMLNPLILLLRLIQMHK